MAKLYNLARMTTATVGTGPITLGAAAPSYLTFADAGAQNGDIVGYAIIDGSTREIGRGTYSSIGPTLSRDTVLKSTNGGAAINLSGNAQVFVDAAAEDVGWSLIGVATPSGVGAITFSSIPATYKSLKIVGLGRSAAAGTGTEQVTIQFNGDTGANYVAQSTLSNGATVSAIRSTGVSAIAIGELPKAGDLATVGGAFEAIIPFYSNATFGKGVLGHYITYNNTTTSSIFNIIHAGTWNNAAAINQLTIISGPNWVAGSEVRLYGLS